MRILWHGLAGLLLCSSGVAETRHEVWPELDIYAGISDRSRVVAYAGSSRLDNGTGSLINRSPPLDANFGINLDFSLSPTLRKHLLAQHWERNRYLWTRIGYQRAHSVDNSDPDNAWREHRGIAEFNVRTAPLYGGLEWFARARWDYRSRNEETSSLYRARVGVEKQIPVAGYLSVPYADVEAIYDTRYQTWKQTRYRIGAEITLSPHWRIEPGLTLQLDELASPRRLVALGLALKYFH